MCSGRGCQRGLGICRATRLTQLWGMFSSWFSFVRTAICVNYDPAPSKAQQTSAGWLGHKFRQHLNAHRPLCRLQSNRHNKKPVLPGLDQVPEENRRLLKCVTRGSILIKILNNYYISKKPDTAPLPKNKEAFKSSWILSNLKFPSRKS